MANQDTLTSPEPAGHNRNFDEVVWERKTKHRVFVRALEGTYAFGPPREFVSLVRTSLTSCPALFRASTS